MRASGHIVLTDFDLSICSPETVHSRVTLTPYSHKGGVVSEPDIRLQGGLIGTMYGLLLSSLLLFVCLLLPVGCLLLVALCYFLFNLFT
jgi:hypothetical protein